VALAPGRDSVTAPSVAAQSRVEGAILGALVGAAAGGAAAYLWVKTQSRETQEWETLLVLYGAAVGALVGLLVGAVAAA
jgi:hypothetical protein